MGVLMRVVRAWLVRRAALRQWIEVLEERDAVEAHYQASKLGYRMYASSPTTNHRTSSLSHIPLHLTEAEQGHEDMLALHTAEG